MRTDGADIRAVRSWTQVGAPPTTERGTDRRHNPLPDFNETNEPGRRWPDGWIHSMRIRPADAAAPRMRGFRLALCAVLMLISWIAQATRVLTPRLNPPPASQSGAGRAARPPIRRSALTLLIVMALAAAALFGDLPAQAQTTTTLVSNTGQGLSSFSPRILDSQYEAWGQVFTTGSDATEYRMDSIGIRFGTIHASSNPSSELTVTLNDATVVGSAKSPNDDVLCTLTDPATFTADAVNTFDAPTSGALCPFLKPATDYAVVVTRANNNSHEIGLPLASGDDEDVLTPPTGWTIHNSPNYFDNTWVTVASSPLLVEVKGESITPQLTSAITAFTVQSRGWNVAAANVTVASSGTVHIRWRTKSETEFDADDQFSGEPDSNNKATLLVNAFTHGVRYVVQASQDDSFSDPAQLEFTHEWNTFVRDVQAIEVTFTTALVEVTVEPDDELQNVWVYWSLADLSPPQFAAQRLYIPANATSATTLVEGLAAGTTYVLEVYDNRRAFRNFFFRFPRASFTTPETDFDLDADNDDPKSMWSDGETLWVGDDTDAKVYAYKLVLDPHLEVNEYGARDSDKDITGPSNEAVYVTGDDTYIYVAEESLDGTTRDVFAYNLPDLTRAATKDFDYNKSSTTVQIVHALATDGKHVWLSPTTSVAYAFRLSDDSGTLADEYGDRDSSRDLTIPGSGGLTGLYTDGEMMWGTRATKSGATTSTVESVNLDGTAADCDFALHDDNDHAAGIWSDGPTMYVLDSDDDKIYTYSNPCPPPDPGLILSESALDISEGDNDVAATYNVRLARQPTADVTVTLTPSNTDVTVDTDSMVGDQNTLAFTTSNWDTDQTVTVTVGSDADAVDDAATITHTASGATEYAALDTVDVTVTITDDETAEVISSSQSLSLTEPDSGTTTSTYTLRLTAEPTSPVSVFVFARAVTPARDEAQAWTYPDITVGPFEVVLDSTNWNTGETVTVTLSTDTDAEDDVAMVVHDVIQNGGEQEFAQYAVANTTVNITDPETPLVEFKLSTESVWSAAPDLTIAENGSLALDVRLSHQPRSAVTVRGRIVPQSLEQRIAPSTGLEFMPARWSAGYSQRFELSNVDDADSYPEEYTVDFSVSGYGSGTVADLDLTVTDDDPVDAYVEPDPPEIMIEEQDAAGGTYTIKLASKPSTHNGAAATVSVDITSTNDDITVTPNPVVLNSSNWETGVEVTVLAIDDADGVDDTATLSHFATSQISGNDGDYHNVSIPDVTVTVTDNDPVGVEFQQTTDDMGAHSVTVTEDGTHQYGVRLTTEPTDTVTVTIFDPTDNSEVTTEPSTLTFDSSNYTQYQQVTVSAAVDDDTVDDTATITHTVTQAGTAPDEYEGIAVADVSVSVTDPDRSAAVLTSTGTASTITELTVLEEGTATYDVALSHQPASVDTLTVTLTVTGSGTQITVDTDSGTSGNQNTLEFTSSNWDTTKVVTVTGVADTNIVGDTFTIAHAVTGTRASTTSTNLTVTRTDNDVPNLDLGTTTAVTVPEGGNASYSIELTQEPSATVTLTVTATGNEDVKFSTDSCATLTGSGQLEFSTTDWNTAKSLTVCGAEDYDATNDTADLSYSASGGGYGSLNYPDTPVTVTDDDTEGITISPTSVDITEVDGGVATGTYEVSLSAAPTGGSVTVAIAVANNDDVTTIPTSLTFALSDWTTAGTQTVAKSAEIRVADDDGAGDETADIVHTQGGVAYGPGIALDGLTVIITDTDNRGVTIAATDPFTFNEGGSLTYTVVLDTEPTGAVTVSVDDLDSTDEIRVDKTALEFTIDDWDQPQTVRVSADADDDAVSATGTINHGVAGADYGANSVTADPLTVNVTDLNTRSVSITPTSLTIGEGFTDTYEVVLGTRPSGGTVTISITSDNTEVTVDPDVLEFTADNWDDAQEVTVTAEQEDADTSQDTATLTHAVSGADYGANSETAPDVSVTVNDDDGPMFSTSADSLTVIERTDENPTASSSYTVVLDTLPVGGDVTITITPADNPDIKLLDPDSNDPAGELALVFTASNWNTPQTVAVVALEDPDALDDRGSLNHVATGANFGGSAPDVSMSVMIDDKTLAAVGVDPTTLSMTEGRTGKYGVVLQSQPQANVVIVVSSSDAGAVSASPGRLTFTSSTWDQEQEVTLTAVSDSDGDNESVTIVHSSSGSSDAAYAALTEIDGVVVSVVEDGSARSDTSSFLRSSPCDGYATLTWNSPTTGDTTIASYRIEWRTGEEQFDSSRSSTADAGATSHTLSSLTTGVEYTIRVVGLDEQGMALWSGETTATPSAAPCIAEVSFGNILYDSAPVIVDVEDAVPGTQVNLRHRSLNPGVWSDVQTKHLEADQSQVTFDIYGLAPDHEYEVQAWLGASRTPPSTDVGTASVVQRIFKTPALPEGVTIRAGSGGGGSFSRILRIEPSIRAVTVGAGDEVMLSVEVYGRQEIHNNGLADKHQDDERPAFTWSSGGNGAFSEADIRPEWQNGIADDRVVRFTAPSSAGTFAVEASLDGALACLAASDDETAEDQAARCSARIEVTVLARPERSTSSTTTPVNPPEPIPETLTDSEGVAYAVFTPVDGGSFLGDGYSLVAGPGAVANGEFIGISMAEVGEATNVGKTWHRYTLGGSVYAVDVIDRAAQEVAGYVLSEPATACMPMPPELRGNISDIVLVKTDGEGESTVLSTRIRVSPEGVTVCGALSTLPANLAVAKTGAPPEIDEMHDETDATDDPLPDTGGTALRSRQLAMLLVFGLVAAIAGSLFLTRTRGAVRLRTRVDR